MSDLLLSIGAMKAGTTWLYDKLKQHPEIAFSQEKEIHYLAQKYEVANSLSQDKRIRRMQAALRKDLRKGEEKSVILQKIDWYGKYLSDPVSDAWFMDLFSEEQKKSSKYVADFSNLNCHLNREQWNDVLRTHPNVRILYIMRDPIKRIWSHFKYHLEFSKNENRRHPDSKIELFRSILGKEWFRRNAEYSKILTELKASVPSENAMIFYFEDMVANPSDTLRKIENFLDIRHFDFNETNLTEKKNQSIDTPIPAEWVTEIFKKYQVEFEAIHKSGLWHPNWTTYKSIATNSEQ